MYGRRASSRSFLLGQEQDEQRPVGRYSVGVDDDKRGVEFMSSVPSAEFRHIATTAPPAHGAGHAAASSMINGDNLH